MRVPAEISPLGDHLFFQVTLPVIITIWICDRWQKRKFDKWKRSLDEMDRRK